MTFLNPIAWLFLALLPVVVLLYLRRVRRQTLAVPTLLFWQRAMGEQRHRAFLGKLRQWLSLLLQIAILLFLLFALLRPEPKGISAGGESTVILLDTRARMQALEPDGASRFRKAVDLALQRTAGAREGASVALLGVGPESVQVISPFSSEPDLLRERLEALQPGETTGNLTAAIAQARELLTSRPGAHRLLVITGESVEERTEEPAVQGEGREEMEVIHVGSSRNNVAITGFAARPQLASPQTADLFLSLANFSDREASGTVEISCNGQLLDVKPFTLPPGERRTEVFPALPRLGSEDGRFTARLEPDRAVQDALALDNTARAVMPAVKPLRVLLVSKGNWFLEKLFAADPGLRFDFLTPDGFRPEMARSFDVVVFDQCGPAQFEEVAGNALFIKSGPIPPVAGGEEVVRPVIAEADAAHPLLRMVEWGNVTLMRAARLAIPERQGWQFQTPLRDAEVPLIIVGERREPGKSGEETSGPPSPRQRLAVFAFDIAESDLPLRIAFPLLMANTLQWLSGLEVDRPAAALCGDLIALQPGESVQRGEDGDGEEKTPMAENIAFQPLHADFYEISGEAGKRWLAVNAFSEAESDLRQSTASASGRPAVGLALASAAVARPLWQWLAFVAFVLLALEWWLFHRRHTE